VFGGPWVRESPSFEVINRKALVGVRSRPPLQDRLVATLEAVAHKSQRPRASPTKLTAIIKPPYSESELGGNRIVRSLFDTEGSGQHAPTQEVCLAIACATGIEPHSHRPEPREGLRSERPPGSPCRRGRGVAIFARAAASFGPAWSSKKTLQRPPGHFEPFRLGKYIPRPRGVTWTAQDFLGIGGKVLESIGAGRIKVEQCH